MIRNEMTHVIKYATYLWKEIFDSTFPLIFQRFVQLYAAQDLTIFRNHTNHKGRVVYYSSFCPVSGTIMETRVCLVSRDYARILVLIFLWSSLHNHCWAEVVLEPHLQFENEAAQQIRFEDFLNWRWLPISKARKHWWLVLEKVRMRIPYLC